MATKKEELTQTDGEQGYAEDTRRDRQALQTRDILRAQPQISIMMAWTEEDEQKFQAADYLPYPKVEPVNINGVQYYLERGKMHQVPLSVAIILANGGKIPWDMIPDKIEGHGEVREKATARREREKADRARQRRYAGIGEGLVK